MNEEPRVQEGIRCSHGVQGPYAAAGSPVANCGERGTLVYRLLYPDGQTSEWNEDKP